jgi:hypothetical protein
VSDQTTRREFLVQGAGRLGTGMLGACRSADARPPHHAAPAGRRPNFVFIFDDQLRACDVGFNGGPNVGTPRIDRLASQGVVFTNAISTCPLCTPYRGMLMTGRYPTHTGLVVNAVESNPREYCLANAFRDAGYDTGFIGKWHLAAGSAKHDGKFRVNDAAARDERQRRRDADLRTDPEPEFVAQGPQRHGAAPGPSGAASGARPTPTASGWMGAKPSTTTWTIPISSAISPWDNRTWRGCRRCAGAWTTNLRPRTTSSFPAPPTATGTTTSATSCERRSAR